MTNTHPILRVFAGLAVCGLLLFTLAGAAFISAGTVYVSVHQKNADGINLSLPVPVNLAHIALSLIPDEELADVRAELDPWMPVINIVMSELADCPDGVLVQVEDGDETVSIVKRGRKLVIDIDTRDESVHVSIPIRGVARLIDRLGSGGNSII